MIKQKGFTLVEMMIAFTLSAILMLGLFQIFNSNKQAFSMQDGMARVQENGRIAMELLSREMRVAGYMGCASGANFTSLVDPNRYANGDVKQALSMFESGDSILGFDNVDSIPAGSALEGFNLEVGTGNGQIISGSDVIIIQGARPCDGGQVVWPGTGTANIKILDATSCGLDQDDIVIISNCSVAEAFGITNNPSSGGGADQDTLAHSVANNTTNFLSGTYDTDSYIYNPSSVIFYLGNGASGEPALFMKVLQDETVTSNAYSSFELAEGIEGFQILYGEDTDNDSSADRYLPAETATLNLDNVVAIRTMLLVRSQDGITQTNQTYTFNGATTTAADNRMRVVYETTNAIRNRVN